jgi:hypothetical protein
MVLGTVGSVARKVRRLRGECAAMESAWEAGRPRVQWRYSETAARAAGTAAWRMRYDGKFRSFGGGNGDAAHVERKRRRWSTARSVIAALRYGIAMLQSDRANEGKGETGVRVFPSPWLELVLDSLFLLDGKLEIFEHAYIFQ